MNSNTQSGHGSQEVAEASKLCLPRRQQLRMNQQCENHRYFLPHSTSVGEKGKGTAIFESQMCAKCFSGCL